MLQPNDDYCECLSVNSIKQRLDACRAPVHRPPWASGIVCPDERTGLVRGPQPGGQTSLLHAIESPPDLDATDGVCRRTSRSGRRPETHGVLLKQTVLLNDDTTKKWAVEECSFSQHFASTNNPITTTTTTRTPACCNDVRRQSEGLIRGGRLAHHGGRIQRLSYSRGSHVRASPTPNSVASPVDLQTLAV
jgi:hypothetical protein